MNFFPNKHLFLTFTLDVNKEVYQIKAFYSQRLAFSTTKEIHVHARVSSYVHDIKKNQWLFWILFVICIGNKKHRLTLQICILNSMLMGY